MGTLFQFSFLLIRPPHQTMSGDLVSAVPFLWWWRRWKVVSQSVWCQVYKLYRRAIWQTIQGSMGNNSFINEYMLLVAETESHLARVPKKKAAKTGWDVLTLELWMLQQSITIGSILHLRCLLQITWAPFLSPAVNIFSSSNITCCALPGMFSY